METPTDSPAPTWLEPLRRYVPLLIWVIVVFTLLVIPLKIIGFGYLPADDALRAAAKAVSGKTWPQILILDDVYKIDHEYGWSLVLAKVHALWNANPESIVIFSVVSLFLVAGLVALPWLRYPEAWLAALTLSMVSAVMPCRLMLGRPFIITIAALFGVLFIWRKYGSEKPKLWMAALITAFITASVYFHGTWYLWALPVFVFFLAGQFRWGFTVAGCSIAGVILGCLFTGHFIEYPLQAVKVLLLTTGKHMTQRTLAGELQPAGGDLNAVYILCGLLLVRRLAPLKAPPFLRDPVFWLVALSWALAFKVGRFWGDWGWPALMVLVACDLQLLLASRLPFDSFRRLGLSVGLALLAFLSITCDAGSRWTYTLTQEYLTTDNQDLAGWMPEKDGILYSADMTVFYQTFYKNPYGDWRYILGFESTLMRNEDFEVYHKVLWNYGDAKAYQPWLLKMTPADRLVIRGGRSSPPNIPQLEWNYGISGTWIGRLPGKRPPGAPVTIPATESISSLTNATSSASSPTPSSTSAK